MPKVTDLNAATVVLPGVSVHVLSEWSEIQAAFASCPAFPLRQHWQSEPDKRLQPAEVRLGKTEEAVLLFATIQDSVPHNPVKQMNEAAFQFGDVFEIFLQPPGQASYYEIHVTPDNVLFQLHIPSEATFREQRSKGLSEAWKCWTPLAHTRVIVDETRNRWLVLVALPHDLCCSSEGPFRLSCCRYDYLPGFPPVISSISPFHVPDFHRTDEWLTFRLS